MRPLLSPELVQRVTPQVLARDQVVPVADELLSLLPAGGLARGSTTVVSAERAGGARTMGLALVAEATQRGSWVACVGMPEMSLAAAADMGVALERVAVIDQPETQQWPTVVAALLGACDLILTTPPKRVRPGDLRRLQARGRERGSVLLSIGASRQQQVLRDQADLTLTVRARSWEGLGVGHGHLQSCRAVVEVSGRRQAARAQLFSLWLPGPDGRVQLLDPPAQSESHHYAGGDLEQDSLDQNSLDQNNVVPLRRDAS